MVRRPYSIDPAEIPLEVERPIPPEVADYVASRLGAPEPMQIEGPAPEDFRAAELDDAISADRKRTDLQSLAQNLSRAGALIRGERVGPLAVPEVTDDVKAWVMKQQAGQQRAKMATDRLEAAAKMRPKPGEQSAPPEWGALPGMTRDEALRAGYAKPGKEAEPPLWPGMIEEAEEYAIPTEGRKPEAVVNDVLRERASRRASGERAQERETERDIKGKGESAKTAIELRKELQSQQTYKDTQQLAAAYKKIQGTGSTGAGDISLIFSYMKMVDPGSTVREGEFATAENAGGIPARLLNSYNKVVSGEKLPPQIREQFRSEAGRLFESQFGRYKSLSDQYRRLAERAGGDPADGVLDLGVETPGATPARAVKGPEGKPDAKARATQLMGAGVEREDVKAIMQKEGYGG